MTLAQLINVNRKCSRRGAGCVLPCGWVDTVAFQGFVLRLFRQTPSLLWRITGVATVRKGEAAFASHCTLRLIRLTFLTRETIPIKIKTILTYSIIELVTSSSWSKRLGSPNSCYNSSISSLLNKEPMYVVLASDSEDASIFFTRSRVVPSPAAVPTAP